MVSWGHWISRDPLLPPPTVFALASCNATYSKHRQHFSLCSNFCFSGCFFNNVHRSFTSIKSSASSSTCATKEALQSTVLCCFGCKTTKQYWLLCFQSEGTGLNVCQKIIRLDTGQICSSIFHAYIWISNCSLGFFVGFCFYFYKKNFLCVKFGTFKKQKIPNLIHLLSTKCSSSA